MKQGLRWQANAMGAASECFYEPERKMTTPRWKLDRADELECTVGDLDEWYEYLDNLRASGETNMYGAGSYLEAEFDMERKFASKVLGAWMKDFGR